MKSANVMEYEKELTDACVETENADEQRGFIAGVKWSETESPVIKRLESALNEIAKEFGTDYCDGNTILAYEALAYLNEIQESVK